MFQACGKHICSKCTKGFFLKQKDDKNDSWFKVVGTNFRLKGNITKVKFAEAEEVDSSLL